MSRRYRKAYLYEENSNRYVPYTSYDSNRSLSENSHAYRSLGDHESPWVPFTVWLLPDEAERNRLIGDFTCVVEGFHPMMRREAWDRVAADLEPYAVAQPVLCEVDDLVALQVKQVESRLDERRSEYYPSQVVQWISKPVFDKSVKALPMLFRLPKKYGGMVYYTKQFLTDIVQKHELTGLKTP